MNYSKNKLRARIAIIAISLCIATVVTSILSYALGKRSSETIDVDGEQIVISSDEDVISRLSVHAGSVRSISLWGRTYKNVRGGAPYFLRVPDSRLLVFVTSASRGSDVAVFHVIDLAAKKHIEIPVGNSEFGIMMNIPGDIVDSVRSLPEQCLALSTFMLPREYVTVIDILHGRVLFKDQITYDKHGVKIKVSRYEDGAWRDL